MGEGGKEVRGRRGGGREGGTGMRGVGERVKTCRIFLLQNVPFVIFGTMRPLP